MEYKEYFRQKYEVEDPWRFGTCPFEKVRHAAMTEFALVRKPCTAIDLGCGEGHFLAYLLNRAPNLRVVGIELEPAAANRCRTKLAGYNADIITVDLLNFLEQRHPDGVAYDAVIFGDVLYFLSPETVAQRVVPRVASLLKPGGGLVLSYADVNTHEWSVEVFRDRFKLERQVYIKPVQEPPPWPWVVSLLTLEGGPR